MAGTIAYKTLRGKVIKTIDPTPVGEGGAFITDNFEALADLLEEHFSDPNPHNITAASLGTLTTNEINTQINSAVGDRAYVGRTIETALPLTGGGNLTQDRLIEIAAASAAARGTMSATHFSRVESATPEAVPNTFIMRGADGGFKVNGPVDFGDDGMLYKVKVEAVNVLPAVAVKGRMVILNTDNNLYFGDGNTWKTPTGGEAVTWDTLENKPPDFPPSLHTHPVGQITGLGSAAILNADNTANNLAILDSNGKLSTSVLPSIAVNDVFPVGSQPEMLSLVAQRGDVAIRTDISRSFILRADDPTVVGNWQEILAPAGGGGGVTSVNGLTGTVNLTTTQVGEGTNLYYTTARVQQDAPNVTLGVNANGLTLSGQQLNLALAAAGSNAGAMSATDKTKLDGIAAGATANTGTVTSVGLSLPAVFTVTGSPVTGAGTLTATFANQSASLFLASPTGAAGTPIFRSIAVGDLPTVLARLDVAADFTKRLTSAVINVGNTSGTYTADSSLANEWRMTLIGNLTLAISNPVDGQTYTFWFTQDTTGNRTLTLPANVVGNSDTPLSSVVLSTAANSIDCLTMVYVGGSVAKFRVLSFKKVWTA